MKDKIMNKQTQTKKPYKKKTYYKKSNNNWKKYKKVKKVKQYRNPLERWVDKYNHTLELIRTITGFILIALQLLVLYKLFN